MHTHTKEYIKKMPKVKGVSGSYNRPDLSGSSMILDIIPYKKYAGSKNQTVLYIILFLLNVASIIIFSESDNVSFFV
jgi:hypothetical protein